MKKLLFIVCLFLSSTSYSQIYIDCYTDGDTLSNTIIDNSSNFKLADKHNEAHVKLKSFEIIVYGVGNSIIYNKILTNNVITPEIKKKMKGAGQAPAKIVFDNIMVTSKDGIRKMSATTFYRAKVVNKTCINSAQ